MNIIYKYSNSNRGILQISNCCQYPDILLLKPEDQLPCHMTHTNEEVEKIVMETIHLNRHVQQEVKGPR